MHSCTVSIVKGTVPRIFPTNVTFVKKGITPKGIMNGVVAGEAVGYIRWVRYDGVCSALDGCIRHMMTYFVFNGCEPQCGEVTTNDFMTFIGNAKSHSL